MALGLMIVLAGISLVVFSLNVSFAVFPVDKGHSATLFIPQEQLPVFCAVCLCGKLLRTARVMPPAALQLLVCARLLSGLEQHSLNSLVAQAPPPPSLPR